MRYVLDCSVAIRWQVPQTHSDRAISVLEQFKAGSIALVAPDVIVPELGHALRKLVIGGKLDAERASRFLDRFLALRIESESTRTLAGEALDLALRHSATFYDALYVTLAIREDCQVLTADERMERAFAKLDRISPLASFG